MYAEKACRCDQNEASISGEISRFPERSDLGTILWRGLNGNRSSKRGKGGGASNNNKERDQFPRNRLREKNQEEKTGRT